MRDKPSILIVDDDESTRRTLTLIFDRQGYETETAAAGQEALEKARERFFNLAVLDIRLPDVVGVELLAPLKQMHPAMELIMATAYASIENAVQALNEGAAGYITKPLNMDAVLATVREVLDKQRLVAEKRQAQERIAHLNAVLRAIRSVNRLTTEVKEPEQLIQGVCESLIETRGYHSAWVAIFDETGELATTTEAGLGEAFSPLAEQLEYGELTDCGRRALAQPEAVFTEDPPSTCADCPLATSCVGWGVMTVRLEHRGKVYGLLCTSIPAHLVADEEEQALLREVGEDVAFALHNIGLEEERKRVEEALRASEHDLLEAQRIAHVGSWVWNLESDEVVCSNEMLRIWGYRPEKGSLTLQEVIERIHPEDRDRVRRALERAMGDGVRYESEFRVALPDGRERVIRGAGQTERGDEGRPPVMHGTGQDITERKRAEEERDRILSLSQDLICTAGMDGFFKYVNPAWEQSLGYSTQELLLRPFLDFIHPDDHGRNDAEVARLAQGLKTVDFENRYVCKDGSIRHILWTATSLRDEGVMYCIGRDITERKQAEEELRKHREHLEEVVAERTADLRKLVNAMAGREVRMADLKDVIRKLRAQLEEAGLEPVADDPLLAS